jgi:iron transport multicopper oxidase
MSAFAMFNVWIDDHKMTIIEVDGVIVQPYEVDAIPVAAGQRYSVIVTAKVPCTQNYKLHADFEPKMFDNILPNKMESYATIMYDETVQDLFLSDNYYPDTSQFDDYKLIPVEKLPSKKADLSIIMNADFSVDLNGVNHGHFNDIVFQYPDRLPLVTALISSEPLSLEQYEPLKTNAHILILNQMVQLVINNQDSGEHPFHLHGHVFQIVAKGKGTFNGDWDSLDILQNPMRRDTVCVEREGYVIIRFVADNPGVHFFQLQYT